MVSRPVQRVYIGLPAYNEEVAIGRLFEKIKRLSETRQPREFTVVVYNDGSTDRTVDIVLAWQDKLSVVLRGQTENLGLGAGLKDLIGYVVAVGQPNDLLVVMDCDDTHDPDQIPIMILAQEAGNDCVIASRFRGGASVVGVSALRRLAALGAMILLKTIHPIAGITDYTCGYRAYRVGLLQQATTKYGDRLITERGFTCMVELLLKLGQLDATIAEIPLHLRYDLKPTSSKMDADHYIRRLLRLVVVWRWRGFDNSQGHHGSN
jgi:dolichol-phosphate mannosyltransferase